jgi:hypothetical protein
MLYWLYCLPPQIQPQGVPSPQDRLVNRRQIAVILRFRTRKQTQIQTIVREKGVGCESLKTIKKKICLPELTHWYLHTNY